MGKNSITCFALLFLYLASDISADAATASLSSRDVSAPFMHSHFSPNTFGHRPQAGSEVSDLEESKRFGYMPSRGRKADEGAREGVLTGGPARFDEGAKRAFHGARGKKVAMQPMYPYGYNLYQWKRGNQYPVRSAYATNGLLMDQGQVAGSLEMPAPVRPVFRNVNADMLANEGESAEEYLPDPAVLGMFANQPFYSRLV